MSTKNRQGLHEAVVQEIRRFIAGAILQNQKIADEVGLHLTDTQCINVLELVGPTTPGNLARSTGLTTGGVTVMLDRLEKAGYVKREPNPQDRRSLLVRTNPRKLEKLHSYYGEINRLLGAYLEETSEADLATVVTFLAGMNSLRAETPHGKAGPAGTAGRGSAAEDQGELRGKKSLNSVPSDPQH
jgi:MarR family transcriptional regulator, organic hydroperoxide resistance regulator